ncbi:MAG TPA: YpjP family protein [Bacillales bacterium]|nr:YpjP family protein [Bacillales bacterium]
MVNWMKKIFVTFVAALTFGIVVPNSHVTTDRAHNSKANRLEKSSNELDVNVETVAVEEKDTDTESEPEYSPSSWEEAAASVLDTDELRNQFKMYTVQQVEQQGFQKFGPVISDQVGEEYLRAILPEVETVIDGVATGTDEETLRNLAISGSPAGGFGEKILHIYDSRNGQDLIRFHVRRDHPPLDGYWFNFHYHIPSDEFQEHHDLGNIFWDKDTPPQWMA